MIDVERSPIVPASLARNKSLKGEDLLEALHRDFLGKCYLCERRLAIGELEIEHRRPQAQWPEDVFHWTNLFPACGFCNGRRARSRIPQGLLSPGDGIEQRIVQLVRIGERGTTILCEFYPADPDDVAAQTTAEELTRLHSGQGTRSPRTRLATRCLLDTIHDHFIGEVHPLEVKVLRGRERRQRDELAESRLASMLSRKASFTMLMRSLVHRALADLFD